MPLLAVKQLIKTFSNGPIENTVLKGISFEVHEGEFISIMGQSGSGKSTLLFNISGMDTMTEGSVQVAGHELAQQSQDALADLRLNTMGFIFQHNYLLKHLNLLDNICLPALKANSQQKHPEPHSNIQKRARALMKKLDIEHIAHHGIHQASGGQLQRAAICRALINNPRILFADEPTGALNARSAQDVLDILGQLNQEKMTLLTVTHDPKVASVTDRIIYLKDGQIEDQLQLGKFLDPCTRRAREERTLSWLIEKGF